MHKSHYEHFNTYNNSSPHATKHVAARTRTWQLQLLTTKVNFCHQLHRDDIYRRRMKTVSIKTYHPLHILSINHLSSMDRAHIEMGVVCNRTSETRHPLSSCHHPSQTEEPTIPSDHCAHTTAHSSAVGRWLHNQQAGFAREDAGNSRTRCHDPCCLQVLGLSPEVDRHPHEMTHHPTDVSPPHYYVRDPPKQREFYRTSTGFSGCCWRHSQ